MKKFISLVLAGIMTFSLAACGQNATANQTAVQQTRKTLQMRQRILQKVQPQPARIRWN